MNSQKGAWGFWHHIKSAPFENFNLHADFGMRTLLLLEELSLEGFVGMKSLVGNISDVDKRSNLGD